MERNALASVMDVARAFLSIATVGSCLDPRTGLQAHPLRVLMSQITTCRSGFPAANGHVTPRTRGSESPPAT